MDIAVTRVHVQGHEHAAAQNLFMHRLDPLDDRPEIVAFENLYEPVAAIPVSRTRGANDPASGETVMAVRHDWSVR